jgi:predicted aconitase with swiveling domain
MVAMVHQQAQLIVVVVAVVVQVPLAVLVQLLKVAMVAQG